MTENSWKSYNERVLKGDENGRTMLLVPYGVDDFEFYDQPLIKERFLNAYNFWKYWNERRAGIVSGFLVFGSLVNGVISNHKSHISDTDLVLFSNTSNELKYLPKDKQTNCAGMLYNTDIDWEDRLNLMSQFSIGWPSYVAPGSDGNFEEFKFHIIGIPFGEEAIRIQSNLITMLQNLPKGEFDDVWRRLSTVIRDAETGRNHMTKQKYGIIGEPLTFEQFLERWKKRVNWSRKFCMENGITF